MAESTADQLEVALRGVTPPQAALSFSAQSLLHMHGASALDWALVVLRSRAVRRPQGLTDAQWSQRCALIALCCQLLQSYRDEEMEEAVGNYDKLASTGTRSPR